MLGDTNGPQPPERARIPRDGDLIAVPGAPGMGKTTTICRGLVRDVARGGRRALLLDTTGDLVRYLTEGSAAGERLPAAWVATATTAAQAFAAPASVRVVALTVRRRESIEGLAAQFLEALDAAQGERWVFACDEAELCYPMGAATGIRLRTLKLLRNRRQRLYLAFQRPQAVATIARSNATFVLAHGGDSEAYVAGCGEFGSPRLYEPVLRLPQFHYLYRDRWREDRMAPLPVYDGRSGPLPWPW